MKKNTSVTRPVESKDVVSVLSAMRILPFSHLEVSGKSGREIDLNVDSVLRLFKGHMEDIRHYNKHELGIGEILEDTHMVVFASDKKKKEVTKIKRAVEEYLGRCNEIDPAFRKVEVVDADLLEESKIARNYQMMTIVTSEDSVKAYNTFEVEKATKMVIGR